AADRCVDAADRRGDAIVGQLARPRAFAGARAADAARAEAAQALIARRAGGTQAEGPKGALPFVTRPRGRTGGPEGEVYCFNHLSRFHNGPFLTPGGTVLDVMCARTLTQCENWRPIMRAPVARSRPRRRSPWRPGPGVVRPDTASANTEPGTNSSRKA